MSTPTIYGPHGRENSAWETAQAAGPASGSRAPITFHDVLEAINPLQYMPVIGTIYRVATGDDGSPTLRTAGSLIGGLLMGGPVGLLTSIAGQLAEHYLHLEHMARSFIVPGAGAAAPVAMAATQPATAPATAVALPAAATGTVAGAAAAAPGTAPALTAAPDASPHLAVRAVAAYARFAMDQRFVPGGRQT